MKYTYFLLAALSFFSCKKQNINYQEKHIDTLEILHLNNNPFREKQYKILLLYNIKKDSKSIDITRCGFPIKKIIVPNSVDVKNFSVSQITETDQGFKIIVDWGGGCCFYIREFDFIYKNGSFYFSNLLKIFYSVNSDDIRKNPEKIDPLIPLNKFYMPIYIQNDI